MRKLEEARPPVGAVEDASWEIAAGITAQRTVGAITWAALGAAYPKIARQVVDGLLEDLEDEIRARAHVLSDEFDEDAAYSLGCELDDLSVVRAWLEQQRKGMGE